MKRGLSLLLHLGALNAAGDVTPLGTMIYLFNLSLFFFFFFVNKIGKKMAPGPEDPMETGELSVAIGGG